MLLAIIPSPIVYTRILLLGYQGPDKRLRGFSGPYFREFRVPGLGF